MAEVNAPNVLRVLRDHGASSIDELSKQFGISRAFSTAINYAEYHLENALRELHDAGLVVEGAGDRAGTYEVAPHWPRTQAVLGISLKELGEKTSDSVIVKPFF